MTMLPYCVVLSTCPDLQTAQNIAQHLTELGLIACANIIPHISSIYFWSGEVKKDDEVLMILKTHQEKLPDLEKALIEKHPYDVPEFIALPVIYGSKGYLNWIDKVTQ